MMSLRNNLGESFLQKTIMVHLQQRNQSDKMNLLLLQTLLQDFFL